MKSKVYIGIIILLVILLIIQSAVFFNNKKYTTSTIESYHNTIIKYSNFHIITALKHLNHYKDNKQAELFYKVSYELQSVSEFIQLYSIYYEYNSEGMSGPNITASQFFDAYSFVPQAWGRAIENKDYDNIPSDDEIKIYISDVEQIAKAFGINDLENGITRLSFKELDKILFELAEKTKSEAVKQYFGVLYEFESINNFM